MALVLGFGMLKRLQNAHRPCLRSVCLPGPERYSPWGSFLPGIAESSGRMCLQDLSGYNTEKFCDSIPDKKPAVWDNSGEELESLYKNKKTSSYEATCRPWYQRAQRSRGSSVVFNPVPSCRSVSRGLLIEKI